jgi:SRSO17 transposase
MVKPRPDQKTVTIVDEYCSLYRDLFPEVRSYEYFKYLHIGLLSGIKRKTLPAIAREVGLENEQGLHHFLTSSPWLAKSLKERRLKLILSVLEEREIIVIMDETGDKKKGKTTDYVKRQYIGNIGKVENGIVSVNAYGLIEGMTLPLTSEVYKPKERLKEGEQYKSKPEIAAGMVKELLEKGFKIKRVLADSEYGESESNFLSVLEELGIEYAVAIRSNHSLLMGPRQRVRRNRWHTFNRIHSDGEREKRYIREIIFGKRRKLRYWEITTDKETIPEETTWYVMTKIECLSVEEVGNIYGERTWVEYGFRQSKNEFGWSDYRLTNYSDIEKWWELVMSVYLMVSLQGSVFQEQNQKENRSSDQKTARAIARNHPWWSVGKGWKDNLNNIRLFIEPFSYLNRLKAWLCVFFTPRLIGYFSFLYTQLNRLINSLLESVFPCHFCLPVP